MEKIPGSITRVIVEVEQPSQATLTRGPRRGLGTNVDVAHRYPREPVIKPSVITQVIQSYKERGPDHPDTELAIERFTIAVAQAKQRGFSFDAFAQDLERTFLESRIGYEDGTLGSEPGPIVDIREQLTEIALNQFETTQASSSLH